eukprot:CAMPEP_0196573660 /NCGR_PEP_ID=MMETSP1081-20130531/3521_1 /TAXON_ID=36882 /ORGANISM="Pyramimonas amylifera, Strain CCMP720" /LENGTH=110 /DNA_ID=CAMNT_0041891449 /DNA_START=391 /DNA_END=723 /DNA_ORIENTATION=-
MEPPISNNKDLLTKKVAIFGLGDQKAYPDNFCDSVGLLYDKLEMRGAEIIGRTSCEGYEYNRSRGSFGGEHLGLFLDEDNQANLTDGRLEAWVAQLKEEFSIGKLDMKLV